MTGEFMKLKFLLATVLICLCCLAAQAQEKQKLRSGEGAGDNKTTFKIWLEKHVLYIITPEEKKAALTLKTEAEQEKFVEDFWRRRDPQTETEVNEFKDEYYERIAYTNEHFSSGIPGWKTDRGKIYILYGKPDRTEKGRARFEENENVLYERWFYRQIPATGANIELTFIDPTETQEFRLTKDKRDEFLNRTPNGLTICSMCP
jgi:GWxTD domain-containing protein